MTRLTDQLLMGESVEKVCHEYFTRPDFRSYVRDHYSDVDKAMVALRDSDKTGVGHGTGPRGARSRE